MKTKGINHLALVCHDMAETVKFYTRANWKAPSPGYRPPAWKSPSPWW